MGISHFDAVEYLDSPESRAEYLRAALETEDVAFILDSIEMVRATGKHGQQHQPNAETQQAIDELNAGKGKRFPNVEDLFADVFTLDNLPDDVATALLTMNYGKPARP